MKILILNRNDGSSYHRVVLPVQFMKGHEIIMTDKIVEELLYDIDILWVHWNAGLQPWYLSLLRTKYGFKIIVDIDDSWEIPKNHILYKQVIESSRISKNTVSISDYIFVSNSQLKKEVSKLNPNVRIVLNRIPYGYRQFKVKKESLPDFMNRKIRIGVAGGSNHYNDWIEIQGWVASLYHKLKDEAEFYICGRRENEWFKKLEKKFPFAKFIEGSNPDNYIHVYDLDIMLCPLENNTFNRFKSDLKIHEAVCNQTLCVLDPIYKELSEPRFLKRHIVIEKDRDWLEMPVKVCKDKVELYNRKTKEIDYGLLDYFDDCVIPRIDVINSNFSRKSPEYTIWSIKYLEDQLCDFTPYLNMVKTIEEKSYLFEYNPMLKLIPESIGKYVGIFSHKFNQKTGLSKYVVEKIIDESSEDVISFCQQIPNYLQWTEKHHPGFLIRFNKLCRLLGLRIKEPKNIIYSNFFIAKPEIYLEYLELIKKAINILETEMKDEVWSPVNYNMLTKDQLKSLTGLDYYTWHTFLLERLISIWIDNKNLKVKNII